MKKIQLQLTKAPHSKAVTYNCLGYWRKVRMCVCGMCVSLFRIALTTVKPAKLQSSTATSMLAAKFHQHNAKLATMGVAVFGTRALLKPYSPNE